MTGATGKLTGSLRIIGAIAAKDIVDAIKNRTTLTTILSVLFLMVVYRLLPSFENAGALPRLALYDAGRSRFVDQLESRADFDLYPADSKEKMEAFIGNRDNVVLGLTLPGDFDQRLVSRKTLELEGYVVHWADDGAAAEVQSFFEEQLSALAGKQVRIHIAGNTVYTRKDSAGYAFLAALSVIFSITMVGVSLVPNIMLEEKDTKTLDALLVSPASPVHIVLGKAVTGLFYCLTGTAVAYAFNLALVNQWWLAILAGVCGSVFTVALGLLVGSTIGNRAQLMLWAWVLLIPLLVPTFLSVMKDVLPAGLLSALQWIPTVALSKLLRLSFSNRAPWATFGPELVLIAAWTVLVLVVVTWVVRRSDRV